MMKDDKIQQRISSIVNDREHGSRWLVREAIVLVKDLASMKGHSQDEQMRQLFAVGRELAQARPAMAALASAMGRILTVEGGPPAIAQAATEVLRSFEAAPKHMSTSIPAFTTLQRVMTCSSSGTVLEAFSYFPHLREVVVLEGRPRYEGRAMAHALVQKQLAVTLITDAQADIFLPDCQAVVVGADTVLANGDVINKAGTALLAWAARGHDRPFYVLCETLKISPQVWYNDVRDNEQHRRANEALLEEKEPEEVLEQASPGVRVRNFYFDHTPYALVQAIVTELGVVDQPTIAQLAMQTQKHAEALTKQSSPRS